MFVCQKRLLLLAFFRPRHLEGPGNVVFRGTSSPSKMWKAPQNLGSLEIPKLGKPIIFSGEKNVENLLGSCNSFAFLKNDAGNELGVPDFFVPNVLLGRRKIEDATGFFFV